MHDGIQAARFRKNTLLVLQAVALAYGVATGVLHSGEFDRHSAASLLAYVSVVLLAALVEPPTLPEKDRNTAPREADRRPLLRLVYVALQLATLAAIVVEPRVHLPAHLLSPFHVAALAAPGGRRFPAAYGVGALLLAAAAPALRSVPYLAVSAAVGVVATHQASTARAAFRAALAVRALRRELDSRNERDREAADASAIREEAARIEERSKLSAAVHDAVGHSVTGALLHLESARYSMDCHPAAAKAAIVRVEAALRKGLEMVREHLSRSKPAPDRVGLRQVETMVFEFDSHSRFAASLDVRGPTSAIAPAIWEAMKRNLEEALANCVRHSSGNRVDVTLAVLNRAVRFEVHDNGHVGRAAVRRGIGLEAIEERTVATGGRMTIDTSNGFSLLCLWRRDG